MGSEMWIRPRLVPARAPGTATTAPATSGADSRPRWVMMKDGTRARLRPAHLNDEIRLLVAFARASREALHRRLLAGMMRLSEAREMIHGDPVNESAWVAVDADAPGEPALGVGRYRRLAHEPTIAEVAVAVVDTHQHLGLGRYLLEVLRRSAVAHGIETFRVYVLRASCPTIRALRDLGATVQGTEGGELLCFDVPVPRGPEPIDETAAGRALHVLTQWTDEFYRSQ